MALDTTEIDPSTLDPMIPNWRQLVGGDVALGKRRPIVGELNTAIPDWRQILSGQTPNVYSPLPFRDPNAPPPPGLEQQIAQLQTPTDYSFLTDFANQPTGAQQYLGMLPESQRKFSDFYKAPEDTSDKAFQDYLAKINAPGATEEVRARLETEALQQILEDIDRDTAQQIADLKMQMFERGIAGPGQNSDIEQVALAQARTAGGRTKAQARTTLQSQRLEREAEKERAVRDAYGARYGAEVQRAGQERGIAAQAASADVQAANQLLQLAFTTGVQTQEAQFNRLQRAQEVLSQLNAQEKQQTLNNMYQLLMSRETDATRRAQIDSTFKIALMDANSKWQDMMARNTPRAENNMWDDVFKTLISSGAEKIGSKVGETVGTIASSIITAPFGKKG